MFNISLVTNRKAKRTNKKNGSYNKEKEIKKINKKSNNNYLSLIYIN